MRVNRLGPLQIVDERPSGEVVVTIAAAKQRAVLAVLLVYANRVVPLERIIDELWEEAPPAAVNLVRQYVSHLRKVLAPLSGARVHTHTGGYLLELPAGGGDAGEFERLAGLARRELADGRPVAARQAADRALALWRGRAFADVPGGRLVAAERERLDELRSGVQELGALADLRGGNVVAAISDLKALVVEHPLRESLHAALISALLTAGRKAEALAAYRSARATIVDELGLEPGEGLRRLERAILADEVAPPTAVPVRPPAGPVPAQMPADLPDFVGREVPAALAEQMLRAGDGCAPVVVLSGVPGVGKTALAVRLGHRLRRDFPDGQIFLRLSGGPAPLEPLEVLGRALEVLGHPLPAQPRTLAAREDLYRRVVADRQILTVLDGAVDEAQVRALLPGRGGGAVLVTSRSRLAGLAGARHLAVPVFAPGEAVRLLALVAGVDRVAAEPGAARAIGHLCGLLPLAVRVAGMRLSARPHRPLRHLAERLRSDHVFDELAVGDLEVRRQIAAAYAGLTEGDREMLGELARSAGTAPVRELDLGVPADAVDRLVEAGALAVVPGDGEARFSRAELLVRYARQHAAGRGDTAPAA